MGFGTGLFQARKKRGLSQEDVAEKLGVSRQTISKWESDETIPDLCQSQKMARLYRVPLDELAAFDTDVKEIQELIETTDEKAQEKMDWTKVWAKKYPILAQYQEKVDIPRFAGELNGLLGELEERYGFGEQDAFLVLKDILFGVWKDRKGK